MMSCGHNFLATNSAMPERHPNVLASYCSSVTLVVFRALTEAVVKTPPPTPKALPFSEGSLLTSTAAYYTPSVHDGGNDSQKRPCRHVQSFDSGLGSLLPRPADRQCRPSNQAPTMRSASACRRALFAVLSSSSLCHQLRTPWRTHLALEPCYLFVQLGVLANLIIVEFAALSDESTSRDPSSPWTPRR